MADLPEKHQPQPTPTPTAANPVVSFFSNFFKLFDFRLPPLPPAKKAQQVEEERGSSSLSGATKANPIADEVADESKKPSVVRYPQPAQEEFPSLTVEGDEGPERDTNPATLWQVYALGGFLVLSWAWRRWNERRGRKKSSDEDPPAPE